MRKFVLTTLAAAVALCGVSAAEAQEMVRCQLANGQWAVCRANGPVVQQRIIQPQPVVGARIGPMVITPVRPGNRVQTEEVVREQSEVPAGTYRGKPYCKRGEYVQEIDRCVQVITQEEAQQIPTLRPLAVDPECRDKPPGWTFDRDSIGPNGERIRDHRKCGTPGN